MRVYTFAEVKTIIDNCTNDEDLNRVAIYVFENAQHYCILKGFGVMKTFAVMFKLAQKSIKNEMK